MPIHLPPITRREFLAKSLTAASGIAAMPFLPGSLFADQTEDKRDIANWLLWSDTHIDKNRERDKNDSGYYLYNNFLKATKEVLETKKNAAGIFINGDCANLYGLAKDYEILAELLEPLSKAGFPVHMTMGNHDNRNTFSKVLKKHRPDNPKIQGRRIGVVEAMHANWFLLDTLKVVNATPGELGKRQLEWLGKELDKNKEKPALIMLHHDPLTTKFKKMRGTGLLDTDELLEVIKPRKNVKAMFFGHTHHWGLEKIDGIHLVNLPAIGRIFRKHEPLGWVDANLRAESIKLELRALDPTHKAHGETHELNWRS